MNQAIVVYAFLIKKKSLDLTLDHHLQTYHQLITADETNLNFAKFHNTQKKTNLTVSLQQQITNH
jgi:hypothetical protein